MTERQLHPACAAFPAMPEKELAELADDVKARGLIDPITVMPDGAILDGRNRWLACERAGVEPTTTVYQGDDPIRFVISRNLKRRHLTRGQRVMIAARIANIATGSNRYALKKVGVLIRTPTITRLESAAELQVGATAVSDGRAILDRGAPHVIAMVDRGEIDFQAAATAVRGAASKTEQAAWQTPADVRAAVKARKDSAPPAQLPSPKKPKYYFYNGPRPKMTPEERGLPPLEISGEQHPDYPPGVSRMQAHIRKHGHVQIWSPTETEQLELAWKFSQLCGHIKRLADGPWPSPADIDGQKPEAAEETRRYFARHIGAAIDRLTAFRDALAPPVAVSEAG
jgi:ParB-like chromosome segregation protein Spo0J